MYKKSELVFSSSPPKQTTSMHNVPAPSPVSHQPKPPKVISLPSSFNGEIRQENEASKENKKLKKELHSIQKKLKLAKKYILFIMTLL